MDSQVLRPTIEQACSLVRQAALGGTLMFLGRAATRRRELGYTLDEAFDAVLDGSILNGIVEPHHHNERKSVLIATLRCFAPGRDTLDMLYVKFILDQPISVLQWKLDGSPE